MVQMLGFAFTLGSNGLPNVVEPPPTGTEIETEDGLTLEAEDGSALETE